MVKEEEQNDKGLPLTREDMRRVIFKSEQLGISKGKIAGTLGISLL